MNYDNETCEGCVYFIIDAQDVFSECGAGGHDGQCCKSYRNCPDFSPSLQCRQVRALELLSTVVEFAHTEGWG